MLSKFQFIVVVISLTVMTSNVVHAATNFNCSYSSYSDEKGNHKADNFDLVFLVDENDDNKSYIIGNNGSENILYVENTSGVSFIEITGTGNVMTTVITNDMKSVHSRNAIIINDLVPSQYYGECTKNNKEKVN